MKNLLAALLLLGLFAGCKKDDPPPAPFAVISFQENDFGTVTFSVTSQNVKTYSWSFGDGSTSTLPNPKHTYTRNGLYSVSLKVTGDGGEAFASEAVTVRNVRGDVIFWMSSGSRNVNVYIQDVFVGTITNNWNATGSPECGRTGFVTFNGLKEGTYPYTAKEASGVFPSSWKGNIRITGGACYKMQLTY